MTKTIKTLLLGLSITLISNIAFSQVDTYSPYSRYGFGELYSNSFGQNKSMGGIGIGLRKSNTINYSNPASYTDQDTLSFIFDFGLYGKYSEFDNTDFSETYNNVNFDHIAISFPVTKWWYSSIGVVPYSRVGYKIQNISSEENFENIAHFYEGSGGINKFYFGNSFNIHKNISIGVNLSYLFGKIEQERNISVADTNSYITKLQDDIKINGFDYTLGIQYHNTIKDKYFYNIGLVFSNKNTVNTETTSSVYTYNNSSLIDTVVAPEINKSDTDIPLNVGIGISAGIKDKLTIGIDYNQQNWSSTNSFDTNTDFSDQTSLRIGAEYIPNKHSIRNYLKKVNYRIGGFYTNSYIKIDKEQIKNYGISFGVGLPTKNKKTVFNLTGELGKKGTTSNNLIEENYAFIGINITFYDIWFFKPKYQ
ncbi:MAG: hypothetical protein PF487_13485 [Bacteroidales bacterium]|jgi:long-subunit fatty acid transport protein|nr:hypothetical protein [Bacteroidales bacterium]